MYKEFFDRKKAVFFDLDGTIVLTHNIWEKSLDSVLQGLGINFIIVSNYLIEGIPLKEAVQRILDEDLVRTLKIGVPVDNILKNVEIEFLKRISQIKLETVEGFWEILDTLKNDKKYKTVLVTNSSKEITEAILKNIGAEAVFDKVFCANNTKKLKPDPEIYNIAVKEMKLNRKEIIVFEDSVSGSFAAVLAGLDVIVIYNENRSKNLYPESVKEFTPSFKEISDLMDTTLMEDFKRIVEENNPHLKS